MPAIPEPSGTVTSSGDGGIGAAAIGRSRCVAALGRQVDLGAVGAQEAGRVGDRALDDGERIVQRGDLGGDLGQAALGVDPLAKLLVQPRVRDADRGLCGEELDELEVGIGEGDLACHRCG